MKIETMVMTVRYRNHVSAGEAATNVFCPAFFDPGSKDLLCVSEPIYITRDARNDKFNIALSSERNDIFNTPSQSGPREYAGYHDRYS